MKVINLPGEQLRKQMTKHDDGFHEAVALVVALGPIFLSAWLLARFSRVVKDWSAIRYGWGDAILATVALAMLAWCVWRLIHNASARRRYKEGLEAELAVAQCLTPLLADGGLVFHDFPADKFNIDHIVIGRGAVFAVETKSRKKPAAGGKDAAKVGYDGAHLRFPTHRESKPIEQAKFQAQWLEKFLGSGVGEPVRVIPVLALPGWFIESNVSRPDVLVSNCRNPSFMSGDRFGPALSDTMRKRIAHVLVERYPAFEID
jgi:hypothetical protein